MAPQRIVGVEPQLDRDALYDPGAIARRVVGRQQTELCAAGRRDAVARRLDEHGRERIDANLGLRASRDSGQLRLLVVGDDPDLVEWHHRDELRAGVHVLPVPDAALAYFAADRSSNPGAG